MYKARNTGLSCTFSCKVRTSLGTRYHPSRSHHLTVSTKTYCKPVSKERKNPKPTPGEHVAIFSGTGKQNGLNCMSSGRSVEAEMVNVMLKVKLWGQDWYASSGKRENSYSAGLNRTRHC